MSDALTAATAALAKAEDASATALRILADANRDLVRARIAFNILLAEETGKPFRADAP